MAVRESPRSADIEPERDQSQDSAAVNSVRQSAGGGGPSPHSPITGGHTVVDQHPLKSLESTSDASPQADRSSSRSPGHAAFDSHGSPGRSRQDGPTVDTRNAPGPDDREPDPLIPIGSSNDRYEREADRIAAASVAPDTESESWSPSITPVESAGEASSGSPDTLPGRDTPSLPGGVDRVVSSPGRPLASSVRRSMERRLGHSFRGVRVHTGAAAARSAAALGASAYTVGSHVVFGRGMYDPTSLAGVHMLAHELVHVIQQSRGALRVQAMNNILSPEEIVEMLNNQGADTYVYTGEFGGKHVMINADNGKFYDVHSMQEIDSSAVTSSVLGNNSKAQPANGSNSSSRKGALLIRVERGYKNIGHSWISVEDESMGPIDFPYGFRPVNENALLSSKGFIDFPDANDGHQTHEYRIQLTDTELDVVWATIREWEHDPPRYHVIRNNCTTFVRKVAESAGKQIPRTYYLASRQPLYMFAETIGAQFRPGRWKTPLGFVESVASSLTTGLTDRPDVLANEIRRAGGSVYKSTEHRLASRI